METMTLSPFGAAALLFIPPVDLEIGILSENGYQLVLFRGEVKTRGMHGKGIKKDHVLLPVEH